jgi:hypothetical protein
MRFTDLTNISCFVIIAWSFQAQTLTKNIFEHVQHGLEKFWHSINILELTFVLDVSESDNFPLIKTSFL